MKHESTELPFPVQVTFRHVDHSPALDEAIRAYVAQLPRFHPRIHGVEVVLSRGEGHGHHQRGVPYKVHVRVAIPGNDVVVGQHHAHHADHEDPFIAVTDAFRAVERKLEDEARIRRGEVKTRVTGLAPARVARLPEGEDHGFLETADGREVYFHKNSVLDGSFEDLEVGVRVTFAEEEGQKGPQASTVHVR